MNDYRIVKCVQCQRIRIIFHRLLPLTRVGACTCFKKEELIDTGRLK